MAVAPARRRHAPFGQRARGRRWAVGARGLPRPRRPVRPGAQEAQAGGRRAERAGHEEGVARRGRRSRTGGGAGGPSTVPGHGDRHRDAPGPRRGHRRRPGTPRPRGLGDPRAEGVEVGPRRADRRDQGETGVGPHGGEVAHGRGQGLPAEVVEADQGQVGVHACRRRRRWRAAAARVAAEHRRRRRRSTSPRPGAAADADRIDSANAPRRPRPPPGRSRRHGAGGLGADTAPCLALDAPTGVRRRADDRLCDGSPSARRKTEPECPRPPTPQAARLGRRGGRPHHPRPRRVVRRIGRRVRPPLPAAGRPRHVHAASPTPSGPTATGPTRTPATWPGSRTAPSSARHARTTPGPTNNWRDPDEMRATLDRAVQGLACGGARCTSCPSRWGRSARRSPTSASRSPTRPTWPCRCAS